MTPAARLSAAIEILDAWNAGAPVEQALTHWARGARYAGSKDRAAIRDHVFAVLRQKGSCAAAGGGASGRALVLGLARLQGLPLSELFTGDRHAPDPASDAELGYDAPPRDAARDLPAWLMPKFEARFGEQMPQVLDEYAKRAPVWIRTNRRKCQPEDLIARLAAEGIIGEAHPEVSGAIKITEGARRLRNSPALQDGWLEIQDLASQWAVAQLTWPQSGTILDYCAGGGGKVLAIADHTDAELYAYDALPQRMRDLPPRAARAGVSVSQLQAPGEVVCHARYDCVLVDAPCSGSGTWRRDPEAKWRLSQERLTQLTELQDQILAQASSLVSERGSLVYMTCSVFHAENEERITQFLQHSDGWNVTLGQFIGPLEGADGFFVASLSRKN